VGKQESPGRTVTNSYCADIDYFNKNDASTFSHFQALQAPQFAKCVNHTYGIASDTLFSAILEVSMSTQPTASHQIDIEEVIRSKNPALLRWMPGFALNYIKKIIHQAEINRFLREHGEKQSFDFVQAILHEFGAEVTVQGLENLPDAGGCVVASNHPLGGLDGIALVHAVSLKRKDLKFIVNDVLMNIKNLNDIFVGVNKHGKNTTAVLDNIDSFYAGSGVLVIFPAGLVSRKQEQGLIRDLEWKKSFVVKSKKFRRNIIPVHIGGRNSAFFYNLAKTRARLGIKANLEMFYLIDEMYHQLGKNIHITIGKPIPADIFDDTYSDAEWAQRVKAHIYTLPEGNLDFNP
jgi:putative hemolysin